MDRHPPRRDDVLRRVVETADERLDGALPVDVPGVAETFGDGRTLAQVLQVRWRARLAAEVERALDEFPGDRPAAVVRAWRRTTRALPGVRLVLDRQVAEADEHSRVRWERRVARQRAWMAARAGLAPDGIALDEEAAAIGAELEAEGRRYAEPERRRTRSAPSLLERIRAVLAA